MIIIMFVSISFIYLLVFFLFYINLITYQNNSYISTVFFLQNLTYLYKIDIFGIVILFLVYIVGYLSILTLDSRTLKKNNSFLLIFSYFILISYIFVSCSDIYTFLIIYELFLLPSATIVYLISPSRRSIDATKYFLIWTQIGSIIVVIALLYLTNILKNSDINNLYYLKLSSLEYYCIFLLLFIGFGIKVPVWPFHFWLTKTHVEAPAGFSMFLSGFLVKTALFGFYKIILNLNLNIDLTIFSNIIILGIIDSSLKMWGQSDLKKLVAYCTIQEMNLIFLMFLWSNNKAIIPSILFLFMHGILSSLMFFIVECIQKRLKTRSSLEISGLLNKLPNLSLVIFIMCLFYSGLPGTLKFSNEIFLFTYIFSISPLLLIIVIVVCNLISILSFFRIWFNVIFGINKDNKLNTLVDLNSKESLIIAMVIVFMILPVYINVILL